MRQELSRDHIREALHVLPGLHLRTITRLDMKRIITALLASAALTAPTFAVEGRWTEGFGQGNLEYFIDAGAGNR